jgi:hypothetical protein
MLYATIFTSMMTGAIATGLRATSQAWLAGGDDLEISFWFVWATTTVTIAQVLGYHYGKRWSARMSSQWALEYIQPILQWGFALAGEPFW